jgi:FkbM family methyltransferase
MEPVAANYKPSLFDFSKYAVYADYFKEYIACKDFKSLGASLKYMFTNKLPEKDYNTRSRMGHFLIRKGTTDFQFINEAYERKVKKYIREHINEFDVFIDAGACIGEYCIWLAKEGKRCIAIEPVNFEAVRKNIALNGLENRIRLFTCGLGNKKERVYFHIPNGLPSSSYLERNGAHEPNVDIETFDSLTPKFGIAPGDRVLMKMDVEGMEPELIEGARNFISGHQHLTLIYEHFESDDYRNDKALSAIARFDFADIDGVNRVAIKKSAD